MGQHTVKVLILTFLFSSIFGCASAQKNPGVSLDKKIGQMLMIGFRGTSINQQSPIVKDIVDNHIGGVILFDYDVPADTSIRNIVSPKQVKKLTSTLQGYADIPLFISIDQEGGKVKRLKPKHGFDKTVSAQYLGSLNNRDSTQYYAHKMAQTLKNLGINTNLAPVVDVNINPENPVIGKLERSFSDNPQIVAKQAKIFIKELNKRGILTSLKHFPGHGSSKGDSHLGVVDVSTSWQPKELIPYREIIEEDLADMIMTAHIFNTKLDSTYPATLSEPTINGLLRDSIGFEGVVVSDDLQMGAIRKEYGLRETIKLSIQAGVDMLVFANNSVFDENIASKAHRIITELIDEGIISEQRIDQSYQRIMGLKRKYLIQEN
ncbi:MAG: glycoside hydrolase family 3 protein [Balneolaceae bacterium]|nr:glycoside hydrolase family 3 protein [Balneolaceae bacterium]